MSDTTRTPLAFIKHLLEVGDWYGSAIELDAYAPHHADGAALEAEARRIVEAGSGRCATCRWWGGPPYNGCQMSMDRERRKFGVGSEDGDVATDPDFGCIQWEGKSGAG